VARYDIKNDDKLQDVTKYLFDNIGNITSPKRIADYLTTEGRKTSNHTAERYLAALGDSFVVYTANRYDIKGKKLLQTLQKHYVVDPALRRLLSDSVPADYGRILENVVYLELLRRFNKVWVGKNRDKEIDFVVRDNTGKIEYYQVALSVRDAAVLSRELTAFGAGDNHRKTLITFDAEEGVHDGIEQRNAVAWLLEA
jgi:predicted AAA+ superfamily ATPase